MNLSTRREFLQMFAGLLGATTLANTSSGLKKSKPLLAFSTLGCPDWRFQQIVDFAAQHNFQGIEIRGLNRQMDLPVCNEFGSAQTRANSLRVMKDENLKFVGLGSSANMHFADPSKRKKNLDDAKLFIDLAHDLNCPYVRVFANNLPKDQERQATMELISAGLLELADYAKGSGVKVLMESHGDFVKSEDILAIMQSAEHPKVGLLWDMANMWTIAKEPPVEVYTKLKKYILHTHIKDAIVRDGNVQYKFLGQGEVPLFEGIDALMKGGYKGFYCFEWEKFWHPEIGEPDVAFADYIKVMRKHFR